jgi:hypothetical protein
MRRLTVLILVAGLGVLGLAAPAQARPTRSHFTTAEAFWYFEEQTGPNTFTETTWYVGVFVSTEGKSSTYTDLYQDVQECTVDPDGNEHCTGISFKYGDTDLSGPTDSFTMDLNDLSSASLDGTYEVQSYDRDGNPVGSPETYRVVAEWTGTGPLFRSHTKFSFHQKCIHFQVTDKGVMRAADATGTLNGTDLGTTSDTFFGGDANLQVEHFC